MTRDASRGPRADESRAPVGLRGLVLAAIGIAIAALVAHGRALPHPFHLDDPILIVGDPRVTTCDVAAIFSQEYWPGEAGGNRVWRPLTTLSLALQWQITHAAWAFRSVNSMIHVLAALALFLLARRVLGAAMPAFAAAALFVVHPLHTTPLNQIIDRADLLATALTLLSCVLAIGAAETRQAWRSAVLMLLIAAALLCKESAIAVVGMLIALHVFTARRGSGEDEAAGRSRGLLRDWTARVYLPACVAIGGVLLVRLLVLGGVGRSTDAINPLDNILANPALVLAPGESAYLARWGTPLAVLAVALGKFAWPSPLSWDYSYAAIDVVRSWRDPRFLAGVLLVIGAIASAAISLRRTRRTFAAIALTASAYAVVANVAIVIGALFAERYMHLTSAGLCLLFVHMVSRIAQSVAPSRGGVATAAVLSIAVVLYAGRSIVRHGDFATPQRLNAVDLSSHPRTARLWASRAADEIAARQWAQAAASASHAIEILDTDPRAWRLLGMARYQMRDADGALAAMQRSIALGGIGSENAATIAADVLKSRGDYAEAIAMLDRYFAAGGRSANLQNNLAWYLLTAVPESLRDPQRAITLAQRAFEMQPAEPDFADTYADALLAVGRGQDAKAAIQRTLGLLSTADARRRALQTKLAGIE